MGASIALLVSISPILAATIWMIISIATDCSTQNKFSKRHNIELIETKHNKIAACSKCGERWVLDEVDEMLFIKRRKWNE